VTHIASLRLTDFRNYNSLDVEFDDRPVVLFGANGSGKTNLLEALSFLSPGRGMRRAKVTDIARRYDEEQAPAWGINARLQEGDELEPLRVSIGQVPEFPRRRLLRLNGVNATGTQLAQRLSLMWLTPAQDRLFTGPAGERRKFLDRFALSHVPGHGVTSIRYEKARSERNRLLSDGINDAGWYEAIETDLANQGAHICQARAITLTHLEDEIKQRDSVFPKAGLAIEGVYENKILSGESVDDIEFSLKEDLRENRSIAQRAGRTLIGPHRSDFLITHIEKSMPAADCSTGEQKALLIGLILAQARAQSDHKPFLLLDEVAAHLDVARRAALIEELLSLGTQSFMTGTDLSLFEAFAGRAQILEVNQGVIKPHSN